MKRLIALTLLSACNVNVAVQQDSVTKSPEAIKQPTTDITPTPPVAQPVDHIAQPEPIVDVVTPRERIGADAALAFSVQALSLYDANAPYLRRPISAVWPGVVEELAIDAGQVHLVIDGVHYRLDRLSDVDGKVRADDPTDSFPAWLYIDEVQWLNDYAASARLCISQVYSCRTVSIVLSE